jgi:DNA-binding response OmpR family regulator
MSNLTISIFGNKIFLEIINELKLFPGSKVSLHDSLNFSLNNGAVNDKIIFFFITNNNKRDFIKIKKTKNPIIVIVPSSTSHNKYLNDFVEQINMPFRITNFKKRVISLLAKHKFKLSSLIHLQDYIIDKNERKIKKNDLELQMTEKETNFLILFSQHDKPLSRNFVLKKVWKYSLESDTHTVETHIHRLRKKILEKFNDNNFIKNNKDGYYI